MEKKREVIKAIISLVLLAIIIMLIMVVTFLILQGFDTIGIELGYFSSTIWSSMNGVLIGIGVGFGFVVSKRLFDITLNQ